MGFTGGGGALWRGGGGLMVWRCAGGGIDGGLEGAGGEPCAFTEPTAMREAGGGLPALRGGG